MNKYKVTVNDYEPIVVEADSFYTGGGWATFTIGKYAQECPDMPETVAYFADVSSVVKIPSE